MAGNVLGFSPRSGAFIGLKPDRWCLELKCVRLGLKPGENSILSNVVDTAQFGLRIKRTIAGMAHPLD